MAAPTATPTGFRWRSAPDVIEAWRANEIGISRIEKQDTSEERDSGNYVDVWWVWFSDSRKLVLWDCYDDTSKFMVQLSVALLCEQDPSHDACTKFDHLHFKNLLFSFTPKGDCYMRQVGVVLLMCERDPFCDPDEEALWADGAPSPTLSPSRADIGIRLVADALSRCE